MKKILLSHIILATLLMVLHADIVMAQSLTTASSLAESNNRSAIYIGDSHATQTFGQTFDQHLRATFGDDQVQSYAQCGSDAGSWLNRRLHRCGYLERHPQTQVIRARRVRTPHLASLLTQHNPQYVFVSLGGNYTGRYANQVRRDVDRMVTLIKDSGAQCFWVGPPHGIPRQYIPPGKLQRADIGPLIEATIAGRCTYFNSWGVIQYPEAQGDGIHYDRLGEQGRTMSAQLATEAFSAFRSLIPAPTALTP